MYLEPSSSANKDAKKGSEKGIFFYGEIELIMAGEGGKAGAFFVRVAKKRQGSSLLYEWRPGTSLAKAGGKRGEGKKRNKISKKGGNSEDGTCVRLWGEEKKGGGTSPM